MTITAIEELSKARSKVYIDDEFAFFLYKGELRTYHIRVGEQIAPGDYDEICKEVLPRRAKLRAMNLLARREYTVKQLAEKLKEGFYPREIIEEALSYVESFRYTDDFRYACDYIAGHEDTRSRKRIEQDLLKKGIDSSTLERAWAKWEEQGGSQDEEAMIRTLLKKRGYDVEEADMRERQKTFAFLVRKGFPVEAVCKALKTDEIAT